MVRLFKEYTKAAFTNLSYHAATCRVANRQLVNAQKHLLFCVKSAVFTEIILQPLYVP